MIHPSKPELHRLHSEAVALCRGCGCPTDALLRANDVDDVRREVGRLLFALSVARSVILRASPDAFSSMHDLTLPATTALHELWSAITDEITGAVSVEAAHG